MNQGSENVYNLEKRLDCRIFGLELGQMEISKILIQKESIADTMRDRTGEGKLLIIAREASEVIRQKGFSKRKEWTWID